MFLHTLILPPSQNPLEPPYYPETKGMMALCEACKTPCWSGFDLKNKAIRRYTLKDLFRGIANCGVWQGKSKIGRVRRADWKMRARAEAASIKKFVF